MIEFSEEEISARELRGAAYHEAGHKIIHARFGGSGYAVVWRNPSGNADERAWLGQYRSWTCPEKLREAPAHNGRLLPPLPSNWKALFGMAGLVAEQIMDGQTDSIIVRDALDLQIYCGDGSVSDLASMGITDIENFELDTETVTQAVQYLLEDWWLVKEEAEYLIEQASA